MSGRMDGQALGRTLVKRADFPALLKTLRRECVRRGIDYDLSGGRRVPINYMATPLLLSAGQVRSLHRFSSAINAMIRRMPGLYLAHAAVREALPFPEDEREWVLDCYRPGGRQALVSRIDFDAPGRPAPGGVPMAFEANGVSIGGLYYTGAGPRMIAEVVLDAGDRKRVAKPWDMCAALALEFRRQSLHVGLGPKPRIGILDNREWTEGITEMPRLAEAFEAAGFVARLGDPRDLTCHRGRFRLAGEPVDLLYRNMEARDFADLEKAGARLEGMREAFRRDRVLSGIAGDFDHKSLWEVLSSEKTRHLVPAAWRAGFRTSLLWTRLLRETRTDGMRGESIDLVPFVHRQREQLVIKPNRSCGGDRVILGRKTDDREWGRLIGKALADPDGWVVQRYHESGRQRFPILEHARPVLQDAFVCHGVIAIGRRVGVLGRACIRPVVNVAAGGGLVAVFQTR